jgi:CRP-like cAMP-binding protein
MVSDLALSPLFKNIEKEHITLIEPLFERVNFRSGETVIAQGARTDFIYLIESGRVEISYKPYDGPSITITHLEAGSFFGWSALVGHSRYTSSVNAIEDLKTLRILNSNLRKLCVDHPEAGRIILEQMANSVSTRWRDAHEQIKSILNGQ